MPAAFVPLNLAVGAARLSRFPAHLLWIAIGVAAMVLFVVFPICNLEVPLTSPLHTSDSTLSLLGNVICFAIVALAIDLIWGYTVILSLGHALFFALAGYAMAMYLMRSIGRAIVH